APPARSTLLPYTTLFRSQLQCPGCIVFHVAPSSVRGSPPCGTRGLPDGPHDAHALRRHVPWLRRHAKLGALPRSGRSPERVRVTVPRIPIAEPVLGEEELANVVEAVRSGWISSLGAFIPEFERTFAAFCGAAHGIAVANGTMALH